MYKIFNVPFGIDVTEVRLILLILSKRLFLNPKLESSFAEEFVPHSKMDLHTSGGILPNAKPAGKYAAQGKNI